MVVSLAAITSPPRPQRALQRPRSPRTAAPPAAGTADRRAPAMRAFPRRSATPPSSTTIRSAPTTVASRCAMISVVRPAISRSSASCTMRSLSASSALVASSSSRIGRRRASRARSRGAAAARRRARTPRSPSSRVEALRQPRDELGRVRRLAGGAHFGVARVGPAVAHVLPHARREDHRLLRHDRDAPAHRARIGAPHVDAVDHAPRPTADRRSAAAAGTRSSCPRPTARPARRARRRRRAARARRSAGSFGRDGYAKVTSSNATVAARRLGQRHADRPARRSPARSSSSSSRRSVAPAARCRSPDDFADRADRRRDDHRVEHERRELARARAVRRARRGRRSRG